MAVMFTSHARALSELALASWELFQDQWAHGLLSFEERETLRASAHVLTALGGPCPGVPLDVASALLILQRKLPA